MELIVCIKQVPSSNEVSVDPVSHTLVREKSGTMMNPSDLNAIEAALGLRELLAESGIGEDCGITAITMGPPAAEEILRTAMAMGVDRGCLLTDRCFAGGDTIATSYVLAEGIKKLGSWDLILTGAESSDGATGQVGPMIAQCLSIPHAAMVQELQLQGKGALAVTKKFRNGNVRLRVSLPALLSIGYGTNTPRLPTLRTKMAAKKKELLVYTNHELQLPLEKIGLEGSPTEVTESFRPEAGVTCTFLEGDSREIAGQMLELIEKER